MAASISPEQLGVQLFTNEPGTMGIMATEHTDNEFVFEMLFTTLRAGLLSIDKSYNYLATDEGLDFVNNRMVYIGYKVAVEYQTPEMLRKIVPLCTTTVPSDTPVLNKFHPFQLMHQMDPLPQSYESFYKMREYMHQVLALTGTDSDLVLRFYPVNIQN